MKLRLCQKLWDEFSMQFSLSQQVYPACLVNVGHPGETRPSFRNGLLQGHIKPVWVVEPIATYGNNKLIWDSSLKSDRKMKLKRSTRSNSWFLVGKFMVKQMRRLCSSRRSGETFLASECLCWKSRLLLGDSEQWKETQKSMLASWADCNATTPPIE